MPDEPKKQDVDTHDVRQLVSNLRDDEPDLAWRSKLNERLLATKPSPRRNLWVFAPVTGLAAAAVLIGIVISLPRQTSSAEGLESKVIALHEQSVGWGDMVGTGLTYAERTPSESVDRNSLWTPEDLEAL